MLDSLPDNLRFEHAQGPREQDVLLAEKWLAKVLPSSKSAKEDKAKSEKGKARKGKGRRRR
jgi:hypothetical protein